MSSSLELYNKTFCPTTKSFLAIKLSWNFLVGHKVLLYNSRLGLISGKLRSKWIGPFLVTNVFPYGTLESKSKSTDKSFKVNGHQLKPFLTNPSLVDVVVEETSLLHPTSLPP